MAVFKVYYQRLQAAINKNPPPNKSRKIANYQLKINEQAERIDTLSMENKRLAIQLAEQKVKIKPLLLLWSLPSLWQWRVLLCIL